MCFVRLIFHRTLFLLVAVCSGHAIAATLPSHEPLSIIIIADEVNPHRLEDAQLTQPEDLAPALSAPGSGLNISVISTVDSQCVDDALVALESEELPSVVLYFAHRGALACNGEDAQPRLTALLETGLRQGMGLVVLHHGLYVDFINRGSKADLLRLIGSEADSIEWNTESGQRVIDVSGGHFIASNGIRYSSETSYSGIADVPADTYPVFNNIPDELYEVIREHRVNGETRTPLFATDSGENRLLGYVLQRPGWQGLVVTYQPGEYQPNALDDPSGPNFQVLVNALYYAGTHTDVPE